MLSPAERAYTPNEAMVQLENKLDLLRVPGVSEETINQIHTLAAYLYGIAQVAYRSSGNG